MKISSISRSRHHFAREASCKSQPARDGGRRLIQKATKSDFLSNPEGESRAATRHTSVPVPSAGVSRRKLIEMTTLGAFASTFCPCCDNIAKASEGGGIWDYTNPNKLWSGSCSLGATQSPVDLPVKDGWAHENTKTLGQLIFKYGQQSNKELVLTNTTHGTMQVNFPPVPKDSKERFGFEVKGKGEYDLLQYHFHTPSEHALNGYRTSMECHLVHRNRATGTLGVVGVLLAGTQGDDKVNGSLLVNTLVDDLLETCLDFVPSAGPDVKPVPVTFPAGSGATISLWPKALIPVNSPPYVHYAGSLTTPPCTEGVDWFVTTNVLYVDLALVERFRAFNKNNGGKIVNEKDIRDFGNSRPVQRPNNRMIDYNI